MSTVLKSQTNKETRKEKQRRVEEIIKILGETYPDTTLALDFSTPLDLLVALILAAQCADILVNQVTAPLFKKYRTPQDWAALDPATLEAEIRNVTFFRNKTKAIQSCCRELMNRFGGSVPESLEELVSLPGVGRKSANVLRGNAFGQPAIGVDRHVGRISQLLGLTTETNPDKIEFELNPLVPDKSKVRFCHVVQTHGRTICLARKPNCPDCPINHLCPYPLNPQPAKPVKRSRAKKSVSDSTI